MQHPRGLYALPPLIAMITLLIPERIHAELDSLTQKRIISHVERLAHPSLKGRKTGTRGAALARAYIARHFRESELLTWSGGKAYEVPFGVGKNMIGVLPGSDPELSKEYVLVSAHYDHEGKRDGEIYPGAADNASGVAVLLETARQLKANPPARSIIFAAFDAEEKMMLGSFAFSSRKDVLEARLAGVINVDMLGRNFLNVITNAVFVAGMESYPELRKQVCDFGIRGNLRVLPIGTDVIGPRSDHVAFENRDVPCLFFSCGTFSDYHRPTDTPDKLDYVAISRAAEVILKTTKALAEGNAGLQATTNDFAAAELATISTVLAEAAANAARIGLRKSDLERFRDLEAHARRLLTNGNITRAEREYMAVEATGILAPYASFFGGSDENTSEDQRVFGTALARFVQGFYFNHRSETLELCRGLAKQITDHRPGAFRTMPRFGREVYRIEDRDISLVPMGANQLKLNVAFAQVELSAEVKRSRWLINSFSGGLSIQLVLIDGEGSLEELQDICLLALHQERTNTERCRELMKVWAKLGQTTQTNVYDALLKERLVRGGFSNELQWLVHCLQHANPSVKLRALMASSGFSDRTLDGAIAAILTETNARPNLLTAAIERVTMQEPAAALGLCKLLWNAEPIRASGFPWAAPDYPFRSRPMHAALLSLFDKQLGHPSGKRVGDVAYKQLKKISGRDFGRDETAWREWLDGQQRKADKNPGAQSKIAGSP